MSKRHAALCNLKRCVSALKSSLGETLVETLVSTLIVSAVVLMLSTAVVTAARVNAKAAQVDTTFNETMALPDNSGNYSLEVNGKNVDTSGADVHVRVYEQNEQNGRVGYVFYKHGGK